VGGEKEEERKAGRHGVTVYQLILIRLHTDAESHAIFYIYFILHNHYSLVED